jgi:hypothetical protein
MKNLVSTIIAVAAVLAGAIAIKFIGLSSITQNFPGADLSIINSFINFIDMIVYALGAILALLIIIYIATRAKKPAVAQQPAQKEGGSYQK